MKKYYWFNQRGELVGIMTEEEAAAEVARLNEGRDKDELTYLSRGAEA